MLSESKICCEFVKHLEALSRFNKLNHEGNPVLWFHVRNEFKGAYDARYGSRMKKEGVKAGVADYIFLSNNWCGCLEFKAPKGKLSQSQKDFEALCKTFKISYAVAHSVDEGLEILKDWNVIK